MSESMWLIELDNFLTFAKACDGSAMVKTVTFCDPHAMRFKQYGDADFEARQLESRFPWMKGRLTVNQHLFVERGDTCD